MCCKIYLPVGRTHAARPAGSSVTWKILIFCPTILELHVCFHVSAGSTVRQRCKAVRKQEHWVTCSSLRASCVLDKWASKHIVCFLCEVIDMHLHFKTHFAAVLAVHFTGFIHMGLYYKKWTQNMHVALKHAVIHLKSVFCLVFPVENFPLKEERCRATVLLLLCAWSWQQCLGKHKCKHSLSLASISILCSETIFSHGLYIPIKLCPLLEHTTQETMGGSNRTSIGVHCSSLSQ